MKLSHFFALFLGFSAISHSALAQPPERFALSPGVYADRSSGQLFVMEPGTDKQATAGVAALQAQSGEVIWTNPSLLVPLVVNSKNQLVCAGKSKQQSSSFPLLVIGEKDGRISRQLDIPLDENVTFSAMETASGSFNLTVVEQGEELLVNWQYRASDRLQAIPRKRFGPVGNSPIPPVGLENVVAVPEATAEPMSRTYRVNLEAGEVNSAPDSVWESSTPRAIPASPEGTAQPAERPIPEVRLPQFLSADGQHVIARRRTKGAAKRYLFEFYEKESKRKIGEYPSDLAIVPFYVDVRDNNPVVVMETDASFQIEDGKTVPKPPQVVAVELESGELLWSHPIVERQFRGQIPH